VGEVGPAPATFAQGAGELGVDVGPGVPEADAEALQQLMSRSGYQVKAIRRLAPGQYSVNVWGAIPHAACEFTLRREGAGWQVLNETTWVLFGAALHGEPSLPGGPRPGCPPLPGARRSAGLPRSGGRLLSCVLSSSEETRSSSATAADVHGGRES
jgi:hypothetical protein